jgi:hypothetical protein
VTYGGGDGGLVDNNNALTTMANALKIVCKLNSAVKAINESIYFSSVG